jgi:hypothetical protein
VVRLRPNAPPWPGSGSLHENVVVSSSSAVERVAPKGAARAGFESRMEYMARSTAGTRAIWHRIANCRGPARGAERAEQRPSRTSVSSSTELTAACGTASGQAPERVVAHRALCHLFHRGLLLLAPGTPGAHRSRPGLLGCQRAVNRCRGDRSETPTSRGALRWKKESAPAALCLSPVNGNSRFGRGEAFAGPRHFFQAPGEVASSSSSVSMGRARSFVGSEVSSRPLPAAIPRYTPTALWPTRSGVRHLGARWCMGRQGRHGASLHPCCRFNSCPLHYPDPPYRQRAEGGRELRGCLVEAGALW